MPKPPIPPKPTAIATEWCEYSKEILEYAKSLEERIVALEDLAKIRRKPCARCNGLMLTEPLGHLLCDACKIDVRFNDDNPEVRVSRISRMSKWDKRRGSGL